MKVGYFSFGQNAFQYGLNLCLEMAKLDGFNAEPVDEVQARSCDVVLLSLYWIDQYYDFFRFLGQSGIDPNEKKPILVAGGMNVTLNPMPLADFIHYAVIGDGEIALPELLKALRDGRDPTGIPGVWNPKSDHKVEMQNVSPINMIPFIEQRTNPITRIEIARGCKGMCRFCAISHIKPYREVPFSEIVRGIKEATTRSVGVFAPDRSSHTRFADLMDYLYRSKKTDVCSDIRLAHIGKVARVGKVRFGLEGMSERLRHAVGKRMTDDQVCKKMEELVKTPSLTKEGHLTCDTYFILDLPGEELSDYDALAVLMDKLSLVLPEKFMWSTVPNVFNPQPQTGLQWAGIHLREDFISRWKSVTHGENRYRYKFRIGSKTPGSSPGHRVRQQLVLRGTREAGHLMWNLICGNPGLRTLRVGRDLKTAKKLIKLASHFGMSEEYLTGDLSIEQPLPWDFIVNPNASKEKLIKEWERYRRIMDMEPPK